MADEQQTEQAAETKKSSKLPLIVVPVIMVLEAVAVYFLVQMTSGPAATQAAIVGEEEQSRESLAEIELIDDRFQNLQSGRVWLWQAQIFLSVRQKNVETVNKTLESRRAEINEGIALIFRRAQDRHLREPGLETLNRQLTAYAQQVFGVNDEDGLPRIERIIIPRCSGAPADY